MYVKDCVDGSYASRGPFGPRYACLISNFINIKYIVVLFTSLRRKDEPSVIPLFASPWILTGPRSTGGWL